MPRAVASGRSPPTGDQLEAALVAMDPTTGEVRAMVGGRDFKASRFNRATQALRQPGSAFKPFVYAAALEAGYSPSSLVTRLDEPIQTLQGAWMPEDEHSDGAAMTVRTALRTSSNRAAVRMLEEVGIARTVDAGSQDGHRQRAERAVTRARVGRGHVDGDDVGVRARSRTMGGCGAATFIRRVEDADGKVLFEAKPARRTGSVSADRVPDDEHALRRRQLRHGIQGPAGGLHATRPPERPARRTTTSTRGSSASRRIS